MWEKGFKQPIYNMDFNEREFISDAPSSDARCPTLADLGVDFRKFDESAAWHLKLFNKMAHYTPQPGEYVDPGPPKHLDEDFEFQLRRKIRLLQSE